ncbi:MAG: HAMP domain-containing histidine kinase, partial [Lachnospiraceae bacterium]|nr:HAMP domain-containing histidine kinase [Lachnospiraceae bacterium]
MVYFKDEVDYFVLNNSSDIQNKLADLREVERKGVLGEGDTAVERYTQLAMGAYISDTFRTKTQTASELEVRDDNLEAYAILVLKGDGEEKPNDYYSCAIDKLNKVKEVTLDVKKNPSTAWLFHGRSFTFDSVVLWLQEDYVGWRISLIDGYLKEDTKEFRPGKVLVKYMNSGIAEEEFVIDCSNDAYNNSSYTHITELGDNEILFPEDTENWDILTREELFYMDESISGKTWISPVYPVNTMSYDENFGYRAEIVEKYYIFAGRICRVPFSFMAGNVAFEYKERIVDSNGDHEDLRFVSYAPGAFRKYIPDLFLYLTKYYILFLLIMAFLGWLRYQQLYSLRARTGFHKTLVNSMAHDLKTPLMVMQGFGENLKENVHTEKREYYADQILENVAYLNGLVNKNLDLAKKRDGELLDVEAMYLMDLVVETKERYQEKLEEKKLKMELRGETFLHGDPKLVRVVIDNLISNAIKYAPEGSTINVYGTHNAFTVSNKAMLRYNKNINHLLEPLEMGEESRTAGMGTGLGLSIANGIV